MHRITDAEAGRIAEAAVEGSDCYRLAADLLDAREELRRVLDELRDKVRRAPSTEAAVRAGIEAARGPAQSLRNRVKERMDTLGTTREREVASDTAAIILEDIAALDPAAIAAQLAGP